MIDELLRDIATRGWRVNAIGQTPKGLWMCQIETKDHYPVSASHRASAEEAIAEALAKIDDADRYNWLPPTQDEIALRTLFKNKLKSWRESFVRRA